MGVGESEESGGGARHDDVDVCVTHARVLGLREGIKREFESGAMKNHFQRGAELPPPDGTYYYYPGVSAGRERLAAGP